MKIEEHIAESHELMADYSALIDRGSDRLAAEAMYGAAFQAIQALGHLQKDKHHQKRHALIKVINDGITNKVINGDIKHPYLCKEMANNVWKGDLTDLAKLSVDYNYLLVLSDSKHGIKVYVSRNCLDVFQHDVYDLHNHFYTGRLNPDVNPENFANKVESVREFVNHLLTKVEQASGKNKAGNGRKERQPNNNPVLPKPHPVQGGIRRAVRGLPLMLDIAALSNRSPECSPS